MLTIIDPKDHAFYRPQMDSLLSLLKIYQNFSLMPEEKKEATFFMADNETFGVYGGVVIYPQEVKNLYPSLARAFLEFLPNKEKVWAAQLCFCLEQDDGFLTLEGLDLCERFYRDIYQRLREKFKADPESYFAFTLEPRDYRHSVRYGRWPYLLEVSPSESSDHRFHGLLMVKDQENTSHNQSLPEESCQSEEPPRPERSVQ